MPRPRLRSKRARLHQKRRRPQQAQGCMVPLVIVGVLGVVALALSIH